ncbi:hypothetical protein RZS08_12285, partial [Arthrospira platensis SPKY1]|nr:hypothetical protein [Arthrospira platensis SPKY1]
MAFINKTHKITLRTGVSKTILAFEADNATQEPNLSRKDCKIGELGLPVLRKATQKLEFFAFSRLKRYLPNLHSMEEFLNSDNYLGGVTIEIAGPLESVTNPSP